MNRVEIHSGAARALALAGLCAGALAGGVCSAQSLSFINKTGASLLNCGHDPFVNPWTVMSGGGAVGDFNNDGHQDIFFLGGGNNGSTDHLYINNGDGTFTDESAQWGVDIPECGWGIAVGDYNNDGWLDIYITSMGTTGGFGSLGQHILYRNNGDGTFTNVAQQAGVNQTSTGGFYDGQGAAWGDYDLDGDLDLMVVAWGTQPGGNRLFRNNGDGTFTDVTATTLPIDTTTRGFSPRFVDMNGDHYPELLIAGDFQTSKYFINNGPDADGHVTFTNATTSSGTGMDDNGMGSTVGDFNGDGLLDWYVTAIYSDNGPMGNIGDSGNQLYINDGDHHYTETAETAGPNDGGWGWGTTAVDIDNDGDVDIVETNGWPNSPYEWLGENSYLWLNNGDGSSFQETATADGFDAVGQGRGLLNVDYDEDGDQDIIVFFLTGSPKLMCNELSGPDTNWLRVFLDTSHDRSLAPNGYGSMVYATANGVTRVRPICGGSNYMSQSELTAHFGLGAATTVDELRVEWANGRSTVLTNVAADQTITVTACPCDLAAPGGSVDVFDLLAYLDLWFAMDPQAQWDGDAAGQINVFDLLAYLDCWFTGCN